MNYDHELMAAALHSLNQWSLEEWGFNRENRLFAAPMVSLADVDLACKELDWALENGARMVSIRPAPVPGYRGSRSQIGRAHVGTPVTNAHLVWRLPLEK